MPDPTPGVLLPLVAAADWLEALLPILFVIFWIVSQVMNVAKSLRGPRGPAQWPRCSAAPPLVSCGRATARPTGSGSTLPRPACS